MKIFYFVVALVFTILALTVHYGGHVNWTEWSTLMILSWLSMVCGLLVAILEKMK